MSEEDFGTEEFLEDAEAGEGELVRKDMPSAKRQPAPFTEIQAWTRYTHRMLLRVMGKMIRWVDFWEYEDAKGRTKMLPYYQFETLLALSMSDLFTDLPDDKKSSMLQATKSQLEAQRKHPQYEVIRQAVVDLMRRLKETRGIDGWAELLEDAASQEVGGIALFSKSGREKQNALDTVLDRRSAKKGRGGEGQEIHLHLPESFVSTREEALRIEAEIKEKRKLLAESTEDVIDAEAQEVDATRVRVPDDEAE